MAVGMSTVICCGVTPPNLVSGYRHFGGTYTLHFQVKCIFFFLFVLVFSFIYLYSYLCVYDCSSDCKIILMKLYDSK
jgi:hypothetical protein